MKTINIIGAGRLGTALAIAIRKLDNYHLLAVCNRSLLSAQEAVKRIGEGLALSDINKLMPADITFITTPDDVIASSAKALSLSKNIKEKSTVVHMSGAHTSDLLTPLKKNQCTIASLHPLQAYSENTDLGFHQVYCSIEGDIEAITPLTTLFHSLGAKLLPINKMQKSLYHSAAAYASNFAITLHHIACQQLIDAGIPQDTALDITSKLMKGAVDNLSPTTRHATALTGPIKRNDTSTINRHLENQPTEELKKLYKLLLQQTKAFLS